MLTFAQQKDWKDGNLSKAMKEHSVAQRNKVKADGVKKQKFPNGQKPSWASYLNSSQKFNKKRTFLQKRHIKEDPFDSFAAKRQNVG